MTPHGSTYAYRTFPPERIENRLNEAHSRGWSLHTFEDATDEYWACAVFRWANLDYRNRHVGYWQPPFADDEDEDKEESTT